MERLLEKRSESLEGRHDRPRARLLMCAPDHYGVDYVINPWMTHHVGKAVGALARRQWAALRALLAERADIAEIAPAPGLPDMVFTANAGFVIGRTVVVSRFRMEERRGEEPLFAAWFREQGFALADWPAGEPFEGAGDALPDRGRPLIWCGHGLRTSGAAPRLLESIFRRQTIGLRLIDPRFYHLDTCFCPLAGGWLMYYPGAFDAEARAVIRKVVPAEKRIEIGEADALLFACNAVELDADIVLNAASDALQGRLRSAGFRPLVTPLSEFIKAGGAAKCLTLNLSAG